MTIYRSKDPTRHQKGGPGILWRRSLTDCIEETRRYIEVANRTEIIYGHKPYYCGYFYVEDVDTGGVVYSSNFNGIYKEEDYL